MDVVVGPFAGLAGVLGVGLYLVIRSYILRGRAVLKLRKACLKHDWQFGTWRVWFRSSVICDERVPREVREAAQEYRDYLRDELRLNLKTTLVIFILFVPVSLLGYLVELGIRWLFGGP